MIKFVIQISEVFIDLLDGGQESRYTVITHAGSKYLGDYLCFDKKMTAEIEAKKIFNAIKKLTNKVEIVKLYPQEEIARS